MMRKEFNKKYGSDRVKYVEELKKLLWEDCCTKNDISPNLLEVRILHEKYPNLSEKTIADAKEKIDWLETYFMHCRHGAKTIDKELVKQILSLLDSVQ